MGQDNAIYRSTLLAKTSVLGAVASWPPSETGLQGKHKQLRVRKNIFN